MASFTERVQILIETKVDSAKQQWSQLKTAVSDADMVPPASSRPAYKAPAR